MRMFIKRNFYPLLIAGISFALFLTNIKQNTFLIGWDNLMPELSLKLNIKRSLFGVWQDYRGLGFLDGQSYVANLVYNLFVSFLCVFLPLNYIRYFTIIFLHYIGGLGFYYLAKKLIKNNTASFLGSLFYLFNLGTIQQFFAPFETFAFHFAFLPWLFLGGLNYLQNKNKKSLMLFFLLALLSTPQSFVPTLFMTFAISFFALCFFDLFVNQTIKYFLILFSILLIVNSFWLIPYVYGLSKNALIIQNARINQFSSEQTFLRNKARGDFLNVLFLKGFMMDIQEWNTKQKNNVSFLEIWNNYSSRIIYVSAYILIFSISILGIIKSRKNKQKIVFLFPLSVSFFFLANNTPIFRETGALIRNIFPILAEALRFPFTKFITIFVFCISLFFTFGIQELVLIIKKSKTVYIIFFIVIVLLSWPAFGGNFFSSLLKQNIPEEYFQVMEYFQNENPNQRIAMLPAYTFWSWQYRQWGYVGSDFMWYGIPQSIMQRAFDPWSGYNEQFYNEISYAFKKENINQLENIFQKYNINYLLLDKSIINNLSPKPINYDKIERLLEKSPFITKEKEWDELIVYKINQPSHNQFISLLDNPITISSKTSYFYSDETFEKYGDYIIDAKNPDRIEILPSLFTEKTQNDLEFKTRLENEAIILLPKNNPFLNLQKKENYTLIIPSILNSYLIPARIVNENGKLTIKIIQPSVIIDNIEYRPKNIDITINPNIIKNPTKFRLTESNQIFNLEDTFYLLKDYPNTMVMIDNNGNAELTTVNLRDMTNVPTQIIVPVKPQSSIEVKIPKIKSTFTYENLIKNGDYSILGDKNKTIKNNEVDINASKDKTEIVIYKDNLPHQNGYIFFVNTSWETGLPLDFYVDNPYSHRSEIETKIAKAKNFTNVIILPPTENVFSGYGIHLVANPIGKDRIKANIKDISIYPIPYEVLKQISLEKLNIRKNKTSQIIREFNVDKLNSYLYKVKLIELDKNQNNLYLKLSQAYHKGWKAYIIEKNNWFNEKFPFLFGKELKNHLLVNNWANAWQISSNIKHLTSNTLDLDKENLNIIIIFWPQYLEFIGFGILILTLIYIGFFYKIKTYEKIS